MVKGDEARKREAARRAWAHPNNARPSEHQLTVSAIIVAYGEPESVLDCVEHLRAQSYALHQIIVVDNHADQENAKQFENVNDVLVVASKDNLGYTGGCNLGAQSATGDLLFFINPDAAAKQDVVYILAEHMRSHPNTAVAAPQILMPDGTINAGDNPLHVTGLSWSGGYLKPADPKGQERAILAGSGCALMIRRSVWSLLDGFASTYFLYCDDTDFCWRVNLKGYAVWFMPSAEVIHNYDFGKGSTKWRYLEANRLRMILANYSLATLLFFAPILIALEIGLLAVAAKGGWLKEKLAAYRDVRKEWSWLTERRRIVQYERIVPDRKIVAKMTGVIDTPILTNPIIDKFVNPIVRRYVKIVSKIMH